jgi:excisionase family DNA binding protein
MLPHDPPTDARACLTVSVAEAAQLLGISRTLAYELARRGDLPTLRLGHRLVVPRVALDTLIATAVPRA